MVVFAPIPSVSDNTATAVKAGALPSSLTPYFKSCASVRICLGRYEILPKSARTYTLENQTMQPNTMRSHQRISEATRSSPFIHAQGIRRFWMSGRTFPYPIREGLPVIRPETSD